ALETPCPPRRRRPVHHPGTDSEQFRDVDQGDKGEAIDKLSLRGVSTLRGVLRTCWDFWNNHNLPHRLGKIWPINSDAMHLEVDTRVRHAIPSGSERRHSQSDSR